MLHPLSVSIVSGDGKRIFIDSNDRTCIFVDNECVIKLKNEIITMTVVDDMIIVVTDHPDLHKQISYSMPCLPGEGNVFAFHTNGVLLWRIEEVIGEFRVAFSLAYSLSDKDKEQQAKIFEISLKDDREYCMCVSALSEYYLIDLTEKKLIGKKTLK